VFFQVHELKHFPLGIVFCLFVALFKISGWIFFFGVFHPTADEFFGNWGLSSDFTNVG